MKCIVGLGNPGNRFRETRHNIGFLTVEFLIDKFGAKILESSESYECYQSVVAETQLLLLLPQTYMNDSGIAVREISQKYKITFDDCLIIIDDFQLPFGTLRMRSKGSDGGHNGLSSIIYQLQSDLIPRLRIGVGGNSLPNDHTHETMAEYVLSPFDTEEKKLIAQLLQHTFNSCLSWIETGIQKTMSQYNRNFLSSASAD